MRNSGTPVACAFLISLIFTASSPVRGQESPTVPSLGEIARQLKAQQKNEKQGPVAVFTNDNLPPPSSLGISSVKLEKGANDQGLAKDNGGAPIAASEEHGEKYFRSKAEKLRSRMEFHKRQLDVLKQQLGLAKMQYYPDPQKTLEQESTPAFQTDVDKLRAKITNEEKAVADDQKAMDDLQQELRREGGNPGWIRQ